MRASGPYHLDEWWLEPGKIITDPIHGDVYVTRLEQAFLDTPPMQRLRRVGQLGTTHLVYPGATHTRFSHSLGAVRAAQDLLDVVIDQRNRNHPVHDLFEEWEQAGPEDGEEQTVRKANGSEVASREDNELELARNPSDTLMRQRKCLGEATVLARLGALLHDVGHLPYGHSIEDDLKLLTPHDENKSRFLRLWREMLEAIDREVRLQGLREEWPKATIKQRTAALAPLRPGGLLFDDLLPLILSKERDEKTRERMDAVDRISYPFVADIVGNTICADLLDYLPRDHRFTGLPMSLGQRFMSSFYVTPGEIGGIYRQRVALLIHRNGRPRQDIVTEILKHLRYRYELQERVLVHHLKLTADAMIGKMMELWHDAERQDVGQLSPPIRAVERAAIPSDFEMRAPEHSGRSEPASDWEEDRIVRWRLEQLLLTYGDDGLLEQLSLQEGRQSPSRAACRELAARLLDRQLYRHAANAADAYAAADLYKAFGSAQKRADLEREAAHHAGLSADWHVILWVPGPDMRLKLAEVLVDHGKGIAKFVDFSPKGSDIYQDHKHLWTISVFVHPTATARQTRAVLASLAKSMRISWDRYQDQLGPDPDTCPEQLAAMEVCKADRVNDEVQDLINLGRQQSARGASAMTHKELVTQYGLARKTMPWSRGPGRR